MKVSFINWENIDEEKLSARIFELISEGYSTRISSNIAADEYNLNFSQVYGRLTSKYRTEYRDQYKEALKKGSNIVGMTKTRFTPEMDEVVKTIFEKHISVNGSTTEASIEAAKSLGVYPIECYERWNNKIKKSNKQITRNTQSNYDELTKLVSFKSRFDMLLELHSNKILSDSQLVESLYKLNDSENDL